LTLQIEAVSAYHNGSFHFGPADCVGRGISAVDNPSDFLGREQKMRFNLLKSSFPGGMLTLAAASAAAALLAGGRSADAALILTASEPGFAPITATEIGNTGQVVLTGPVGDFTTNIVIGYTDLNSPSSPTAQLQVESLNVENVSGATGTKTLTVTLQETTPFTFPGISSSTDLMTSSLGGTLTPSTIGDSISFQSFATPSSGPAVATGLETYTFATASAGTSGFQVPNSSVTFVQSPSYLLSDVSTLSLSGGETINVSGTTTITAVPEPVSIGLAAAAALVGLSGRGRRRA
jgi:hypothetical protein